MNEQKINLDNISDDSINDMDISLNETKSNKENDLGIFKELSGDLDFGEEIIEDNLNKKQKKELVDYLEMGSTALLFINVLGILFLVLFTIFLKIENSTDYSQKSFLNPICSIILPNEGLQKYNTNCSSIASLYVAIADKYDEEKKSVKAKIDELIPDLNEVENFLDSTEVKFLVEKSNNKLDILKILNDFDLLKNKFTSSDKGEIVCDSMSITEDSILDIGCYSYSSDWDSGITNGDNEKLQGTSVTLAAAFIKFIDDSSNEYNFTVVDKPTTYNSKTEVTGTYVKSTYFTFRLKYDNILNNLN